MKFIHLNPANHQRIEGKPSQFKKRSEMKATSWLKQVSSGDSMVMNAIVESKQIPQYQQIQAYVGRYLLRHVMTIWQNKPTNTDFQNVNPMNKVAGTTHPCIIVLLMLQNQIFGWFSVSNGPYYLLWVIQSLVSFRIQTISFRIPHYLPYYCRFMNRRISWFVSPSWKREKNPPNQQLASHRADGIQHPYPLKTVLQAIGIVKNLPPLVHGKMVFRYVWPWWGREK